MKPRTTRMGLSIIAGSLSFVGGTSAMDIVVDGSYESSTNNVINSVVRAGGNDGAGVDGGWTAFTTYTYAAGYTQPPPAGFGEVYLRPYEDSNGHQTVSQIDSLTRAITAAQIDGSQGQYNATAWFSTYLHQNDYSDLTIQFLDASQQPIGAAVALGGAAFVAALPADAQGYRAWGRDSRTGLIPPGSRFVSISTTSHALVNLPDGYVDMVSLDVTAGFVPVQVATATPANNAVGVSPSAAISVTLSDGTLPLNTNSLRFTFDGLPVAASVQKAAAVTAIQYTPGGFLAPMSPHSYSVAFGNGGGSSPTVTNNYAFTIAPYANIHLGPPIYLETFDELAEGALPGGWSVQNFTDQDIPGYDLNDFRSDAYLDWVVISRSTLSNLFNVVPDGNYYLGTINVAPNQVINDALVTNLIDGNFIFAVSDRANSNEKQIQYLFTSDYNLSGHNNVYLSFHNIYTQNQDSLGSIEYSIDGGATWLPAQYMLDGPDILRDSEGNIDASNTFAFPHGDVPDLDAGTLGNGHYGRYIGVASNQWASLAPYLAARLDDNEVDSKRVEVIRLTQADNQPAVRFRFAQVGTDSWYFGIDDLGLYSISTAAAPVLTGPPTPAAQTVAAGNNAGINIGAVGLGPLTYQWRRNGVDIPGKTSPNLILSTVHLTDGGNYDVVVTNPGGSVTSSLPATITVINPAVFVTGQWDFNGSLAATIGRDLQYNTGTVAGDTSFGTTTSFSIGDIYGQPATVMHFVPSSAAWGGYVMYHGAAPNGGGAYVNQYTLVFDVYYPSTTDATWRSLWQTDLSNASDGDLFVGTSDGIGIGGVYDGFVSPDTWHRLACAFDLTGPGQAPVLTKFIDGVKVGNQTAGLSGQDGRFSLDPSALLFADNDGDVNEAYVCSVQFSNGRRPDAFLAALGGPSAAKIPGAITAAVENGRVVIRWTGGVPLQSADSAFGPWSIVSGSSPYTVPLGSTIKLYRPKIP